MKNFVWSKKEKTLIITSQPRNVQNVRGDRRNLFMKKFKKLFALGLVACMSFSLLTGCGDKKTSTDEGTSNTETTTPSEGTDTADTAEAATRVAVFLYKFDDTYISTVRQNLEKIQTENSGKVEFTFYDGKGDQATQNDTIDTVIQKDVDLLMVNLVDTGAAQTVLDKIKTAGKPVVFFNREPQDQAIIKSYDKACFVGTNAKDAGIIQGKMVADLWSADTAKYDKNGDGILQYVMLKGEPDNPEAVARTEYSVKTIEEAGIKTEQLELQVCNWDQALAQNAMDAWLSKLGDKIEVVIANNDGMAQGAISALQAQGFNNGDAAKFIPVYGVDATEAAQDLIKNGFMSGTVLQDAPAMAKALYDTGLNIAGGKSAIDGTSYQFDESGFAIRIPYQEFTGK